MKNFKEIKHLVWTLWCGIAGSAAAWFLIFFFIFGGEFHFTINWHSWQPFLNRIDIHIRYALAFLIVGIAALYFGRTTISIPNRSIKIERPWLAGVWFIWAVIVIIVAK